MKPTGSVDTTGVFAAVDARASPIALRRDVAAVRESVEPDAFTILPTAEDIPTAMLSAALGGVDDDDESVKVAMSASTVVADDSSAESVLGPLTARAALRLPTMPRRALAITPDTLSVEAGALVIKFENATDCDTAVLR